MTQIEVFKTNVRNRRDASKILRILSIFEPDYNANFDIDDCDKILRVESNNEISSDSIIELLKYNDFNCEILSS